MQVEQDDYKVWGPPGCGKTHEGQRWLAERIEEDGADPRRVAFVSYTNAAVDVAKERISQQFRVEPEDIPYSATLHALCKRVMGVQGDWLADDHLIDFASAYGWELKIKRGAVATDDGNLDELAEKKGRDSICLQIWDFGRQRLINDPGEAYLQFAQYDIEAARRITQPHFCAFVRDYEHWKTINFLRDYTDLLTEYLGSPFALPISVAVLDEAQDCSPLLWECWNRLTADAEYRACLADDDQAIYSYGGATPELFNLRSATVSRKLTQSYRLPRRIADLALNVIGQNANREPKDILPVDREGAVHRINALDDLNLLNEERWYLLVRNWRLLGQYVEELEYLGVPYRIGGGRYCPWVDRGPYRSAQALVRLAAGDEITRDELRTLVKRLRVGRSLADEESPVVYGSKKKLEEWAKADPAAPLNIMALTELGWFTKAGLRRILRKDWSLLELECSDRDRFAYAQADARGNFLKRSLVHLGSIHGHKGAEAENVVVLEGCAGATDRAMRDHYRREEEVRVAYVAATRAKENLYLLRPRFEPGIFEWDLIQG